MTRRDAVNQIKVLFPQIKQFVSQCTESGEWDRTSVSPTFFPGAFPNQKQIMTRLKKKMKCTNWALILQTLSQPNPLYRCCLFGWPFRNCSMQTCTFTDWGKHSDGVTAIPWQLFTFPAGVRAAWVLAAYEPSLSRWEKSTRDQRQRESHVPINSSKRPSPCDSLTRSDTSSHSEKKT